MTPADAGTAFDLLGVLRLTLLATGLGWAAQAVIRSGLHWRVLPLVLGTAGVALAPWMCPPGWERGPVFGGIALAPTFAGALFAAAFLKLAVLGVAGPRR
jgi:hypothetical protein